MKSSKIITNTSLSRRKSIAHFEKKERMRLMTFIDKEELFKVQYRGAMELVCCSRGNLLETLYAMELSDDLGEQLVDIGLEIDALITKYDWLNSYSRN